jgi:hypothetical protein
MSATVLAVKTIALAVLIVLVGLVGCADHDKVDACVYHGTSYAIGDVFPAGDGCNACTCSASGLSCTAVTCTDGGVPDPASCVASGGCPAGPVCGVLCCGRGERCVNGTCQCGSKAACTGGDMCASVGPSGLDRCGVLCCGVTGVCPG